MTVPRTAATAFGVRTWMTSPEDINARATARPSLPFARPTMEGRPGSSVMVRSDNSRTVTRALPPKSTRTNDFSLVLIRSL